MTNQTDALRVAFSEIEDQVLKGEFINPAQLFTRMRTAAFAALSQVPQGGHKADSERIDGQQIEWQDAFRRSKANPDYHGMLAFTPAQFTDFIGMLSAPKAVEQAADAGALNDLLERWEARALAAEAALARPGQGMAVPEGYKLVPIEYADEQLAAGIDQLKAVRNALGANASDESICGMIYDGMLAAAPTAAQPKQTDVSAEKIRQMAQKAFAFDEWAEKTQWVQEQINTFPVSALGKHRADVMRDEIERLRAAGQPQGSQS